MTATLTHTRSHNSLNQKQSDVRHAGSSTAAGRLISWLTIKRHNKGSHKRGLHCTLFKKKHITKTDTQTSSIESRIKIYFLIPTNKTGSVKPNLKRMQMSWVFLFSFYLFGFC